MKEKKEVRSRWLTVRLSPEEEEELLQQQEKTTTRSLSEYARAVLLKGPVTVLYRNRSADDFLAQMLVLQARLYATQIHLKEAVHNLRTGAGLPGINALLLELEGERKALQEKTTALLQKASEIHALWLQK